MAESDLIPSHGNQQVSETIIGVQYNYQTYGGTLRLAAVEVMSNPLGVSIKVEDSGYSCAKESLVEIFGGWLTLPRGLAGEVGEQLVKLSGGPPGKWRRDYPEETERQRRQRIRELQSAIRQLGDQSKEGEAERSKGTPEGPES